MGLNPETTFPDHCNQVVNPGSAPPRFCSRTPTNHAIHRLSSTPSLLPNRPGPIKPHLKVDGNATDYIPEEKHDPLCSDFFACSELRRSPCQHCRWYLSATWGRLRRMRYTWRGARVMRFGQRRAEFPWCKA
jgi:hypothetical protein